MSGYTISTTNSQPITNIAAEPSGVKINAPVEINGDIVINGTSILNDRISFIEQYLGILFPEPLKPNQKLLSAYTELQQKKQEYDQLEQMYITLEVLKT